jgi:hypothetical protein
VVRVAARLIAVLANVYSLVGLTRLVVVADVTLDKSVTRREGRRGVVDGNPAVEAAIGTDTYLELDLVRCNYGALGIVANNSGPVDCAVRVAFDIGISEVGVADAALYRCGSPCRRPRRTRGG